MLLSQWYNRTLHASLQVTPLISYRTCSRPFQQNTRSVSTTVSRSCIILPPHATASLISLQLIPKPIRYIASPWNGTILIDGPPLIWNSLPIRAANKHSRNGLPTVPCTAKPWNGSLQLGNISLH